MASPNTIQRLLPRHYQIIELYVSGLYTHQQIADIVGMKSRHGVTCIINSPAAQDLIAKKRASISANRDNMIAQREVDVLDRAKRALEVASEDASRVLVEGLLDEDPRIRNKSANDILDRVGLARVSKEEKSVKGAVIVMDTETAARIQQTLELDND
ncbi:MAG: hypothetical protein WCR98_08390 [Saccharofermentanales bacterium]